MKITNEGSDRELPENGTYPARCTNIVMLGTQKSKNPNYEDSPRISFGFQLVDEKTTDGKAVMVYRKFPLSLGAKSHLGQFLKNWLGIVVPKGESIDFNEDVLGEGGVLTIEQTEPDASGKVYANIIGMSQPPKVKGKPMHIGKATEPIFSLSLDPEEFDEDVYDQLPDFVQEQIAESPEYKEIVAARSKPAKASKGFSKTPAKKGKR